MIGFSRGAYTARCVAGVIRRCGLLTAENIRYCPDVVRLFRTRKDATKNVPIRPELVHKDLPAIEFLGLFDTVGSLGVPLWGWWFNWRLFFRNTPLSTDPSPICVHVYHAMLGVDVQLALVGLKVFPVVILGGLDSIGGALIGGLIIGIVESLAAGYLDPYVGGGTKDFAPYVLMILVLMVRPYGIFGRRQIERV